MAYAQFGQGFLTVTNSGINKPRYLYGRIAQIAWLFMLVWVAIVPVLSGAFWEHTNHLNPAQASAHSFVASMSCRDHAAVPEPEESSHHLLAEATVAGANAPTSTGSMPVLASCEQQNLLTRELAEASVVYNPATLRPVVPPPRSA